MKHVAALNPDGSIQYTLYFTDETEGAAPDGAGFVELPAGAEDVHNFASRYVWTGSDWFLRPEQPDYPVAWDAGSLTWVWERDQHIQQARGAIDFEAERVRLRFLTAGYGQMLEYEQAADEAMRFQSGASGEFPLLQAEVDAGASRSLEDAAQSVSEASAQWQAVGSRIRRIRLEGKRRAGMESTPEGVKAIVRQTLGALEEITP